LALTSFAKMAKSHVYLRSPLRGNIAPGRTLDAQVRKGERGAVVVFYKSFQPEKEDQDDGDNKTATQPRLVARASWAFNAEQVDG
jgi:antirestriction protein ArdC